MLEQRAEQRRRWRTICEIYRLQHITAWVRPSGRSMRPLIGADAWALVEFGARPAQLGEIVLFGRSDIVIAHRLVAWHPGGRLVAKGDAEAYCDEPCAPEDILGVVRALRNRASGPGSTNGCAGRPSRLIARISWQSGRAALMARRMAAHIPNPLRGAALRAIPLLARAAAWVLFAPLYLAAKRSAVLIHGDERR